jgi:hypothetical protein
MKCPIQAFVAFAMFIGGRATKPEPPQTAMTGNLVVQYPPRSQSLLVAQANGQESAHPDFVLENGTRVEDG